MSDVLLQQTADGGEITCAAGQVVMTDDLGTAVLLSLFGGNADDSGADGDKPKEWWGNKLATSEEEKLRSETQNALSKLPVTTGNLRRFQDAAQRDLAWMVTSKVASAVAVRVVIPAANKLRFDIAIQTDGVWRQITSLSATGIS